MSTESSRLYSKHAIMKGQRPKLHHFVDTEDSPLSLSDTLSKLNCVGNTHENSSPRLAQDFSDPLLAVTPEKSRVKDHITRQPSIDQHKTWPQFMPRKPLQVHFDNEVEVKSITPDVSSLELSLENDTDARSRAAEFIGDISIEDVIGPSWTDTSRFSPDLHGDISDSDERTDSNDGIENKTNGLTDNPSTKCMYESSVVSGITECALARPEFNTTLKVGKKLQTLHEKDINLGKAVQKKLDSSKRTRDMITEKVNTKLNIEDPQFKDLVSIDVRPEDLEQLLARESSRSKSKVSKISPKNEIPPPDPMELYHYTIQPEPVSRNLRGLPCFGTLYKTAKLDQGRDLYHYMLYACEKIYDK